MIRVDGDVSLICCAYRIVHCWIGLSLCLKTRALVVCERVGAMTVIDDFVKALSVGLLNLFSKDQFLISERYDIGLSSSDKRTKENIKVIIRSQQGVLPSEPASATAAPSGGPDVRAAEGARSRDRN